METLHKLIDYFKYLLRGNYFKYILLIMFSIISKLLLLIPPYINGRVIDFVLLGNFEKIVIFLMCSFFIYTLNASISLAETYLNVYMCNLLTIKFKELVYSKVISLEMSDFEKKSCGEYLERIDSDTSTICSFYIKSCPDFFMNIITLIGTGIVSFILSPQLTFIGILSFPLSFGINLYFGKQMKIKYENVRCESDKITDTLQQYLSGEKTIKALNIENKILSQFKYKISNLFKSNLESGMVSAFGGLAQTMVATIFELIIVAVASYLIISKNLTVGEFISFNVYLSQFLTALSKIASTNLDLQTVLVSMRRIDEVYELKSENILDNVQLCEHICKNTTLNICNVTFGYSDDLCILNAINMEFMPNTISAIVGLSGSGKSTLFNLIMKFYENYKGEIYINNDNIKNLSVNELRNKISYIQQDPFFLDDSIKNNLNIVNIGITEEKMVKACEQAGIYDKIKSMPAGFDTILGDNATILSGGEKQRLAIARGILKETEILLFDEATSNLDSISEGIILETLMKLAKSHIVIMIAHRKSIVEKIPRILVLDKGRIIAEGNHKSLVQDCIEYKQLFG